MDHFEERYRLLTIAESDLKFAMLKNYLAYHGIEVVYREKGFGGPIRSVYFGTNAAAFIEVYVDPGDYDTAKSLIEIDYSDLVEEMDMLEGSEE